MQPTIKSVFRALRAHGFPVFLILGLAACSATAPYRRAEVKLPASYRGAGELSGQQAIGEIPYRSFFSDPVLVALIDSVMVRNYDLQIALKNIDYAQESLKQAKLGFLPSLSLNASGAVSRPSDNSLSSPSCSRHSDRVIPRTIRSLWAPPGRSTSGAESAAKKRARWPVT